MKILLSGALACATAFAAPSGPAHAGTDPYLGDVISVGFNFCPRGWAMASGQILPISTNQSLYSLLGTTFGGDGRTTFALPDLRGRLVAQTGTGTGLSPLAIGERGGVENTASSTVTMAPHTHTITGDVTGQMAASTNAPSTNDPAGNYLSTFPMPSAIYSTTQTTPVPMGERSVGLTVATVISNTGNQIPLTNIQPTQVVTFCIATEGLFPSRS